MIINIRGTHGSGKSSTVRAFMTLWNCVPALRGGQVVGYLVESRPITTFIVGPYETPCGGCDAIKTQDEVCARVRQYATGRHAMHVIYEGALVSTIWTRYANLHREITPSLFAFMSTPLDLCLDRIAKRRAERGDQRPLDPKNTKTKHETIQRHYNLCEEYGLDYGFLDPMAETAAREVAHVLGLTVKRRRAR